MLSFYQHLLYAKGGEMFVPVWIIVVVAAVLWLVIGIGMTKLFQKFIGEGAPAFEIVAPFLVIFWPILIIVIPFGLLTILTDKIFAK